jgi:hypothetical protein
MTPATVAKQGAALVDRGSHAVAWAADEVLRASRAGLYLTSHAIEGNVLPALTFLSTVTEDVAASWHATLAGEKPPLAHFTDLGRRLMSGARYERLVDRLGGELFGSAAFAGQETLARTDHYTLSYLPPRAGVPAAPFALFHVGGFIPYGDGIFRFLPEANFYDRFLERGVPVYAMELAGPRDRMGKLRGLTLERIIDTIDDFGRAAGAHHGGKKLVIEGYCGTGMQMLSCLAAKPAAAARYAAAALFVAPVDARKCMPIAELLLHLPRTLVTTQVAKAEIMRGYLRGLELWAGLDTSLKNVFVKTPLGRFASGWTSGAFAHVSRADELTPAQRFELAAAYWISLANVERYPIPADLIRLFVRLFTDGVKADGLTGATYRGRPIDLTAIRTETKLPVVAFYGDKDLVVQEASGRVLKDLLGGRYRHVVHQQAGHVSYILTPAIWQPGTPRSLDPNPIDLLAATVA